MKAYEAALDNIREKYQKTWGCYAGEALRPGDQVTLKQNANWFMVAFPMRPNDVLDGVALHEAAKDAVVEIRLVRLARTDYERIP